MQKNNCVKIRVKWQSGKRRKRYQKIKKEGKLGGLNSYCKVRKNQSFFSYLFLDGSQFAPQFIIICITCRRIEKTEERPKEHLSICKSQKAKSKAPAGELSCFLI